MKKKDVGIAMVIIAWVNFLVSIINIFINNATLRGIICGVNIVLIILCLVRMFVVFHNHKVILRENNKTFGFREDFDPLNRWHLVTYVKDYKVSTVDLGINHNFLNEGEPLYYETMIFGDDRFEDYQVRYSTKKEAKKGHKEAIKYVKEKLKEK